jgi:hypothetical protein
MAMDPAALQVIIDTAVQAALQGQAAQAQAQAQVIDYAALATAIATAVAPGAPAAVPFAAAPGLTSNQTPWDYTTSAGIKLYQNATAPTSPIFDGAQTALKLFLHSIGRRGKDYGWQSSLFTIPDQKTPPTNRDLLTQYGVLTIANVQAHASTYINVDNRAKQSAVQLAACIHASVTSSISLKLILRAAEYTINGVEDGTCMLKTLISVVSTDSRATTTYLRKVLQDLPALMKKHKNNITEFNVAVSDTVTQLEALDATCEDLLVNLFDAYKSVPGAAFVEYVKNLELRWEEDSTMQLPPESLMFKTNERYKALSLKGEWGAASADQRRIIALQATLVAMTASQAVITPDTSVSGDDDSGGGHGRRKAYKANDGEWAWKMIAPTGNQPKEKTFRNKKYSYCPHHTSTKWVLAESHKHGCKLDPKLKTGDAAPKTKTSSEPVQKKTKQALQYMKALMSIMDDGGAEAEEDEVEEDVEEEFEEDEEV